MYLVWHLKTQTMKSKVEEKWFWICNMKFSKNSPKLHFGVTKKDPGLLFHFHVSNLFKCWSNLGLTEFKIIIKYSKNIKKNWKPVHMVLVCHILTTQVNKQGLDIFKQKIHVCSVKSQISNYELSCVKRGGLWFATWNCPKPHQTFILMCLGMIQS